MPLKLRNGQIGLAGYMHHPYDITPAIFTECIAFDCQMMTCFVAVDNLSDLVVINGSSFSDRRG